MLHRAGFFAALLLLASCEQKKPANMELVNMNTPSQSQDSHRGSVWFVQGVGEQEQISQEQLRQLKREQEEIEKELEGKIAGAHHEETTPPLGDTPAPTPEAMAEIAMPAPTVVPESIHISSARDVDISVPEKAPLAPVVLQREPHVDVVPSEPAERGKDIYVEVYADLNRTGEHEQSNGPLPVKFDTNEDETPILVYLLISEEFVSAESTDSKILVIHRDPTIIEKAIFKLTVENGTGDSGEVTALFFSHGYPIGRVTRQIKIGTREPGASRDVSTPPAVATHKIRTDASELLKDGPDLTIAVIKIAGAYQSFALARNAKDPIGAVFHWKDYDKSPQPRSTIESYYKLFARNLERRKGRKALMDLGHELFPKAPLAVRNVLRDLHDQNQMPQSVLVFTDEPYYAWELMIPEWPDRASGEALPLGYTAAVARWTEDSSKVFRFPAQQIPLGKTLFFAPTYKDKPLESAPLEKEFLVDKRKAEEIDPATYDHICDFISSTDANVLHFICHGNVSSSVGLPVIYAEEATSDETDDDEALDGESGRQSFFDPTITASQLAECITPFCSKRPLIFFNACQVGDNIETFTGNSGFGPTLLEADAGGVVAPLWSVFDRTALDVVKEFYHQLDQKISLAAAVRNVRRKAYDKPLPSGLTTYAAYCYYGDPLAIPVVEHAQQ